LGWPDSGILAEICQNRRNPASRQGSGRIWPDLSGQPAGIRPFWPDSSDIDRMLSNFGTGKISVMVDCLK